MTKSAMPGQIAKITVLNSPENAALVYLLTEDPTYAEAAVAWELALMADLRPLLNKRAGGRDISGLSAYEV